MFGFRSTPCRGGGHHRGWHGQGLRRHRGHAGGHGDQPAAPVLAEGCEPPPAPTLGTSPTSGPAVRLSVCVGRPCRDKGAGSALLDALRREITRSGTGTASIGVQPCGCVDQCDRGPVVIATSDDGTDGPAARPLGTFFHATPANARHIIDSVKKITD